MYCKAYIIIKLGFLAKKQPWLRCYVGFPWITEHWPKRDPTRGHSARRQMSSSSGLLGLWRKSAARPWPGLRGPQGGEVGTGSSVVKLVPQNMYQNMY